MSDASTGAIGAKRRRQRQPEVNVGLAFSMEFRRHTNFLVHEKSYDKFEGLDEQSLRNNLKKVKNLMTNLKDLKSKVFRTILRK